MSSKVIFRHEFDNGDVISVMSNGIVNFGYNYSEDEDVRHILSQGFDLRSILSKDTSMIDALKKANLEEEAHLRDSHK